MKEQVAEKVSQLKPTSQNNVVYRIEDGKPTVTDVEVASNNKELNYWLLKLWLYGLIAANLVYALNTFFSMYLYEAEIYIDTPALHQVTEMLVFAALAKALFAVALLNFQKWGFWGIVMIDLFALIVQIDFGIASISTLMWLMFGLALLFGLLKPGGKQDAWFKLT